MIRSIANAPFLQGAVALALILVALVACRIARAPRLGWNLAALIVLAWCLANAVLGVFAPRIWPYVWQSLGAFAALFVAALALAGPVSGMEYAEFGPDAMIFLAPLAYYPVLLALMGAARFVVALARD